MKTMSRPVKAEIPRPNRWDVKSKVLGFGVFALGLSILLMGIAIGDMAGSVMMMLGVLITGGGALIGGFIPRNRPK